MKNVLLIILFSGISCIASSQIVIGPGEMPSPGTYLTESNDTTPETSVLPVFETGANYSWDFTALNEHDTSAYLFLDVSMTPYAADFPTATAAVLTGDSMFAYFQVTNDYTISLGYAGNFDTIPVVLHYQPADTISKFPFTYGTSFESHPVSVLKFFYGDSIDLGMGPMYVDSIRMTETFHKNITVDGWGQVETPYGTYEALRSMNHQISESEVAALIMGFWIVLDQSEDSSMLMEWYMRNTGVPLISVEANQSDSAYEKVRWLTVDPEMLIGEKTIDRMYVYPNPAADFLTVEFSSISADYVVLTDVSGRQVLRYHVGHNASCMIDVSILNTGMYFIEAFSDGKIISVDMIVKN